MANLLDNLKSRKELRVPENLAAHPWLQTSENTFVGFRENALYRRDGELLFDVESDIGGIENVLPNLFNPALDGEPFILHVAVGLNFIFLVGSINCGGIGYDKISRM